MDDFFVPRVMSTTLHTVCPESLVEDAAQTMLANDIGSVLVVDEDTQLEGILTSTDFVRIVSESHPKAKTPVSAYMTTDIVTVTAHDTIQDAADLMLEHGIHHLPVVDDSEGVIGVVTTTDLSNWLSHSQSTSLYRL